MDQIKKRVILGIAGIALLIGLVSLGSYTKEVYDYRQDVKNIVITDVDLSQIADGAYIGEHNVNLIYAKVEVIVQNGKIEKITLLEHKNERGKSAEKIMGDIIEQQSLDVDAVSGATNSSLVIKKAIENALIKN